jgi:hypothetical protein
MLVLSFLKKGIISFSAPIVYYMQCFYLLLTNKSSLRKLSNLLPPFLLLSTIQLFYN